MSWIDQVNRECSWIKIYYGVLANVINEKGFQDVLEIGVAYGGHADDILTRTNCNYTGIDPYLASYDPRDAFDKDVHRIMGGRDKQHSMDLLYQGVLDRLSRFGDRCNLDRKKSSDAALLLAGEKEFDLVFIDGNHQYNAVLMDIELYWPLIKSGGMMAGDDYDWPGVKKAVHEFAGRNGLTVQRMKDNAGKPGHWFFNK